MSIRLEFDIAFKSDYHVGAGHGLGLQVDSALLRDPDKVPVIRGTVLAGLLRESMENLCRLVGKQQQNVVESIFGAPHRKKRWRISSARPEGLTAPLASSRDWRAGETAAQTTTRVRVNPRTRRAEENKLFTREEGDGSLRFRFVAECDSDDAAAQSEAEWLVAAARLLRNLGAGKRRGYGECDIHLADRDKEAELLERFASRLKGELVRDSGHKTSQAALAPLNLPADPSKHAYRLEVLLRLDEPLLIARRSEAGNQFETLDVIPGSVLRGALAWRIAQRLELDPRSEVYQSFTDLFFRDALRCSPLMPVTIVDPKIGFPSIPAPRDMLTCELHPGFAGDSGEGHGIWSRLLDKPQDTCPICATQKPALDDSIGKLEALSGYISLMETVPRSKHKPKQTVEMHIRIDRKSGRVATGDLYGYVALEPGQYFVGEITCTDANVWKTLETMAGLQLEEVNELKLGKATQRGYGKVSAVFRPREKSLWHLQDLSQRLTSPQSVTMLLLSDAIVSDPWGRFWRGFDPAWLQRELRLPPQAEVSIDRNEKGEALAFSAVRTVDAFNAKLGLPRTRDVAIVAGSSVRLTFHGIALNDLLKVLEEVEAQGIGLRRDEGFGRVAFNHPVYQQLQGVDSPMLDLSPLELTGASTSHPSVAILQFALDWLKKLDEIPLNHFSDERFEAVARLLHTSRQTSAEAIKRELQGLGKPENLLSIPLAGRDKPNFFETDGKQGMEMVQKMLDALADELRTRHLEQNQQAWCIGLQLLAARIAGPARQKAQERR